MSWLKDLAPVAGAVLSATGPVGAVIGTAINAFLAEDEKVTADTPVEEVERKFNTLNPQQQSAVSNAYYSYLTEKRKYEHLDKKAEIDAKTKVMHIKELMDSGDNAIRPDTVRKSMLMVMWITGIYLFILLMVGMGFPYLILQWAAESAKSPADAKTIIENGTSAINIVTSWEAMLALLALPTWVIKQYFTDRSTDKANKLNAYNNQPSMQAATMIGSLANKLTRNKS